MLAGDAGRLARLTAEQADALLHMLAVPEAIPGTQLGEDLGAPRGRLDLVRACFDADGRLRPDAPTPRPTSAGPACTGRSRTVTSR